jgi:RimJ/RimL family protein N-acetyltransferase
LIQTKRLLLRKPVPEDADGVRRYASDPEVMRFLVGAPEGEVDPDSVVERWLARWDANGFGQLVVVRREDGRFVGRSGLLVWDRSTWEQSTNQDAAEPEIELGWTLAREHWGNGYATEAARAARDWALETVGVERLISLVDLENARSIRVVERLGATQTETVTLKGKPTAVWVHPRC